MRCVPSLHGSLAKRPMMLTGRSAATPMPQQTQGPQVSCTGAYTAADKKAKPLGQALLNTIPSPLRERAGRGWKQVVQQTFISIVTEVFSAPPLIRSSAIFSPGGEGQLRFAWSGLAVSGSQCPVTTNPTNREPTNRESAVAASLCRRTPNLTWPSGVNSARAIPRARRGRIGLGQARRCSRTWQRSGRLRW